LGTSENGCTRRRAQYIDHVCSYDFAIAATEDGRRLKVMPIVDEYSRGSAWPCGWSARSPPRGRGRDLGWVVHRARRACLHSLGQRPPEFIAQAIKGLVGGFRGKDPLHRARCAPWENAYSSETFNSRLRDELLDREVFANVKEAKVLAED